MSVLGSGQIGRYVNIRGSASLVRLGFHRFKAKLGQMTVYRRSTCQGMIATNYFLLQVDLIHIRQLANWCHRLRCHNCGGASPTS